MKPAILAGLAMRGEASEPRMKHAPGTPARRIASLLARVVGFCVVCWGLGPVARADAPIHTDPLNTAPLVREAYQHFYTLDYDGAVSRFERVAAEYPNDPIASGYLLNAVLFRELHRLDLLDTTFYANDGFLTGKHTVAEDPKIRDQVRQLSDKTIGQANAELKTNPNNVDALFARGWARSLQATYTAMVERSFGAALHLALQARSDHEHVLQLDPNYVDAKMVVGVYQYVVGALPFAFKLLVGFAGITGSKSKGMELLRDSAARGVITSVESRTAMMLFYRREAKYKDAIAVARTLIAEYPHDFLFCLEEANLAKDDGEGMRAIGEYRRLLEQAREPGYFPSAHLELAWFGLGDSLRGQKMYPDAIEAYKQAAAQASTSAELKRRSLLASGQSYDLMKQHDKARTQYQAVIDNGSDTTQADLARKYMRSAYTGH
jgi:tetratricopeptide (TPR) repeat protein